MSDARAPREESGTAVPGSAPATRGGAARVRGALARAEDGLGSLVLLSMVALPLAAMVARALGSPALASADTLLRHLNLVLAFLGALLAAREGKLLRLALSDVLPGGRWKPAADAFAATVSTATTALLASAALELVSVEREFGTTVVDWLPSWVVLAVMPATLAGIALRLAWRAGGGLVGRVAAFAGIPLGLWIGASTEALSGTPALPTVLVLLVAVALGAPLYVGLGGAALALFLGDGSPVATVPSEMYRLASSPFLAALPLFTVTGYLLTLGGTPRRLLEVFRAWFGWMPGGVSLVVLVVCSFFTVFTGGSGVTILALGGLLLPALRGAGYGERFSVGLLTASGSLGLLFPPALPLILYAIAAEVPIERLFLGGLLPGALLVCVLAVHGGRVGRRNPKVERDPFRLAPALRAAWAAKLELLLPVVALTAIFGGFATVVEAAALTAGVAIAGQLVLHRREVRPLRDGLPALRECVAVLGGVLVLLTVAMGLTYWMVDARVPSSLLAAVQEHVHSRVGFLLALNVFLLLVGCFLDIYSATFVVVPLILPLGQAYGIDPVHLGIVFVANLELGYLTPPIGLNLFLASYRFERPLLSVYRAALPFLALLGAGVLAITYLPFLSTALLPD